MKKVYLSTLRSVPPNNNRTQRLIGLDGLRGLAALAVVVFHYSAYYQVVFGQDPIPWFDFHVGEMGVDLFFMISGFVILLTAERTPSVSEFAASRTARLWPTFALCCLLTTLVTLLFPVREASINLWTFLGNLTLHPQFLRVDLIDGVYWSLLVEVQFYLIIASIIQLGARKHIVSIITGLTILFVTYQLLLLIFEKNNFAHYYLGILRHLPIFLAGIYCYRFYQLRKVYYLVGVALCSLAIFSSHWMRSYSFDLLSHFIGFWVCTALLFLALFNSRSFLQSKFLLFFGRISYPLYLLHLGIGFTIIYYLSLESVDLLLAVGVAFIVSVSAATLVTYYFDEPLRKPFRDILLSLANRLHTPRKRQTTP